MAEPTAQEKLNSLINSIDSDLRSLHSDVRLANLRDGVEDLDTTINGFKDRVQVLRDKGYVYGKRLENKAKALSHRWTPVRLSVISEINRQAPRLESELRPFESQFAQVKARANSPSAAMSSAERLQSSLETFESKVNAAESTIRGMYDSFSNEVSSFKTELDRVAWMLDQLAEGCFTLLATEGCLMAVKATYSRDSKMDKDDPEGVLYLTDQRLIFEQKQEIATKKVLFITTEKKKVQESLLEVPLTLIEKVEASKKGLFKNEDHLAITFKSGAPVYQAWLHLDGQDCHAWHQLIGQAQTRDFDDERTVAIDEAVVEKVRSAPSQCPNCGAPVTQEVLRGMDNIRCEYCQFVIRL